MDIKMILDKWAEICNYDENQTRFNVLSTNFQFNQAGRVIKELLKYDSKGIIPVLYAKFSFETIVKGLKISVLDIMNNPGIVDDYLGFWNLLNSEELKDLENSIICSILHRKDSSSLNSTGELELANVENIDVDMDSEIPIFRDSVEYVSEEIKKLHLDVFFKNGSPIADAGDITFLNTIRIFRTIAECLIYSECNQPENSMSLNYVADNQSTGGHFMFLLRSNGALIGFSDRVDECYVGQHRHSRNGRWTEQKAYEIFPYDKVVDFDASLEEVDYKGYAKYLKTKQDCDTINLSDLETKYIYRIIICATLLISKYAGSAEYLKLPLSYVSSMLELSRKVNSAPDSIGSSEQLNALQVVSENKLSVKDIANMRTVYESSLLLDDLNKKITEDLVISTENSKKYHNYNGGLIGYFVGNNDELVKAYSSGFEMNSENVMRYNDITLISCEEISEELLKDGSYVSEFVGTRDAMELEYYRQCRQQLADHIQDAMTKEYSDFGGFEGLRRWYLESLRSRYNHLVEMCARWYKEIEEGTRSNRPASWFSIPVSKELVVGYVSTEYPTTSRSGYRFILNEMQDDKADRFVCPVSGCNANIWFHIQPCTAHNIEELLGPDIKCPRTLLGWTLTDSGYNGNSLLDATDLVGEIKHPINNPHFDCIDFSFTIGLSKRGLNKLLKSID